MILEYHHTNYIAREKVKVKKSTQMMHTLNHNGKLYADIQTKFYTEHAVVTIITDNKPGTTSFYIGERCLESSEQDLEAHHCLRE